jgi:hypothetical protein
MILECVASLLTSVKAATTEFLASDIFHRLFEACLAACLSVPALLLRDGLHLLLVILDEFGNSSRPGGGGIPFSFLVRMGRFLIQAAHWSTAPANEETAETLRLQILRLLARLPARAILVHGAAGNNGEESAGPTAAEKTASWELEDSLVLQKILAAEFSTDSITAAEVKDFLGYLNVAAGEETAADVLSCGGQVEELEAAYPAVQSASLRAAWLSWTTAGYLVFNKLRSPLGMGLNRISRTTQKFVTLVNRR